MLLKETPNATGELSITLTKANGKIEQTNVKNLVVDTGLNYIVSRMKDASLGVMTHMAVGEGVTPAAAPDTELEQEIGRAALASTVVNANQIVYNATFSPGVGTGAITEAGLFNQSANGLILARTVFPVVNKQTADTLSITWTITIS